MKRLISIRTLLTVFIIGSLLLVSCGISQEDYDTLLAERDSLQAEVASLNGELNSVPQDLEDTQNKLTKAEEDLTAVKGELEPVQNKLLSTTSSLESTKRSLSSSRDQISSLKSEVSSLQNQIASLQSELDDAVVSLSDNIVILRALFNDRPISEIAQGRWFQVSGQIGSDPTFLIQAEYDPTLSQFILSGLEPGTYNFRALFDTDNDNTTDTVKPMPGDFNFFVRGVILPEDPIIQTIDFTATQVIHLETPIDNSIVQGPYTSEITDVFPLDNLVFRWKAIPGASEYTLRLLEYRTETNKLNRTVYDYTTANVAVRLKPIIPDYDTYYLFFLTAKNKSGRTVGIFYITGENFYRPSLRFKIQP